MELGTYLKREAISFAECGRRIGVSRMAVRRYVNGERSPNKEIWLRIHQFSNGEVTPNDHLLPQLRAAQPTGTPISCHASESRAESVREAAA